MHSTIYSCFATLVVVFVLNCSYAQSFEVNEIYSTSWPSEITILSKDYSNRLIVGSKESLVAYNGQTTEHLADFENLGTFLDFYCRPGADKNYLLTEEGVYSVFQTLYSRDTFQLIHRFESEPVIFSFLDDYLIVQDKQSNVFATDLSSNNTHSIPYVGSKIVDAFEYVGSIYLVSDELFKWNKSTKKFTVTGVQVPYGTTCIGSFNSHLYGLNSFGQLYDLNLENDKTHVIFSKKFDKIKWMDCKEDKIYLANREGDLFIYDLKYKSLTTLDNGNGLCFPTLSAVLFTSNNIWSASDNRICLSTDKYPVIADKSTGLDDSRITSISSYGNKIYFSTHSATAYQWSNGKFVEFEYSADRRFEYISCQTNINENKLLWGTDSGLAIVDIDSARVTFIADFPNYEITCLAEINSGNFLIGTAHKGLWSMNLSESEQPHIERLIISSIDHVVDIIGVYDGTAFVSTDRTVYELKPGEEESVLFYNNGGLPIIDIALLNGSLYILTQNELFVVPVTGAGGSTATYSAATHLPKGAYTSVHHGIFGIYLSTEHQLYYVPETYFTKPVKPEYHVVFQESIRKNSLTQNSSGLFAGSEKGLVKIDTKSPEKGNKVDLQLRNIYSGRNIISSENITLSSPPNNIEFRLEVNAPEIQHIHTLNWQLDHKRSIRTGSVDNKIIEFNDLDPGNYSLTVRTDENNELSPVKITFEVSPPFYSQSNFPFILLAGILCIAGLLGWVFHRFSVRKQKKKLLELERQNELLTHRQQALQMQMNPHFLFNALTTIQGLMISEPKNARYYISKLGKLSRMLLTHAREEWVPVRDEVILLSTYLELEKLQHNFEFTIDTHNLEENVCIPPIFLQPLVENAVKHGVSKRKKGGIIKIDLRYAGRMMKCTIRDNGPGISDSTISENHMGVSSEIINERLKAYEERGYVVRAVSINYIDGDSDPGTIVELGLPYKQV